jgi:hypothetical protein
MADCLQEYLRLTAETLRGKKSPRGGWQALKMQNLEQISFFQHERLIHLLVTLFFGLIFVMLVIAGLVLQHAVFYVLVPLLALMLFFYVWHYYRLENGVQQLYRIDLEIEKKLR